MQSGAGQLKHLIFGILTAACAAVLPVWAEPVLNLRSNLIWERDAPWFGGFSAIEVDAGGNTATLLTDRGSLVRVKLHRVDGQISEAEVLSRKVLRHDDGRPLKGALRDAEGLAVGKTGSTYVSFEFRHRVMRLDPTDGRLFPLPGHPDFDGLIDNSGLEALAIHPDGRLFAVSEARAGADGTTPIYTFIQNQWQISYRIPLARPFVPVGADFDAEGRLFLLERALTPLGFRSRIRRLHMGEGRAETLLTTLPGLFDNLEAISIWTTPEGETRLTLVSDDNFLPLQRTQIVEFSLSK